MSDIIRVKTKEIKIGSVYIGGGNPIAIQSMTNTKTSDVEETIEQIKKLESAGCEIVRVGVPDRESASAIRKIKDNICIPLVADIHYDHRLALESIDNGADKIRINPGNIGDEEKVLRVIRAAKMSDIPVRIGVNTGSIREDIIKKYGGVNSHAVLASIRENLVIFEENGFDSLVLSVKSSDVMLNYLANEHISAEFNYPLHIGITESGSDMAGLVRSSVGIGLLLKEGIGDTIRVSLSNDPVEEVKAAYEILSSLGLRKRGVEIISCPTCARTNVDIIKIAREVKIRTADIEKHIKVAIMGCAVNGIGEAKEAQLGIAGGKSEFVLFEKGSIIRKVKEEDAVEELIIRIKRILENDEKTM